MVRKHFFLLLILFTIRSALGFTQIINTIAGGGTSLGDEGSAIAAQVLGPYCGSFDAFGNYYFGQSFYAPRIRMIDTLGVIHTVAGNGTVGFSGDNGIATSAQFNQINGVTVDSVGNIYVSDLQNYRIRKINAVDHMIVTIAGTGVNGYSGDGGLAINANVSPAAICVDKNNNIYFADKSQRIRKINASGVISTIAGTGILGFSGDGGSAINADIELGNSMCLDLSGNLLFGCNGRIRKVDLNTGIISTIAGTGNNGYNGDEIQATMANFGNFGICVDDSNNLYIADYGDNRIRKVDNNGIIHTVAGNGTGAYFGDGAAAVNASIYHPEGVAIDQCGNLYIADEGNDRIRKVSFNPNCWPENATAINSESNISIYPNPVKEQLTITGSSIKDIVIVNTIGQVLIEQKNYSSKAVIDVGALSTGIYFIKITGRNGAEQVRKFLKE